MSDTRPAHPMDVLDFLIQPDGAVEFVGVMSMPKVIILPLAEGQRRRITNSTEGGCSIELQDERRLTYVMCYPGKTITVEVKGGIFGLVLKE